MNQLGHADPKVTLSVYAHVLRHQEDTGSGWMPLSEALIGSNGQNRRD